MFHFMVFDVNVTITFMLALKYCILNSSSLCKDNNGNNYSNNSNNNFTSSYNTSTYIYLRSFKIITVLYETGITTQI
jgi:hypothetical protein